MRYLLFILICTSTFLVPSYLDSKDTGLKLVPEGVPMVPKVPTDRVEVPAPGIQYISIDCNVTRADMGEMKSRYHLDPLWWGVNESKGVLTLHRNEKSGSWALLVTFTDQRTCVVSTGREQQLVVKNAGVLH
jgi:hypothetical protein